MPRYLIAEVVPPGINPATGALYDQGPLCCHTVDEAATAALEPSEYGHSSAVTICGHTRGTTVLDAPRGTPCPACNS